jgi:hypothetical protein
MWKQGRATTVRGVCWNEPGEDGTPDVVFWAVVDGMTLVKKGRAVNPVEARKCIARATADHLEVRTEEANRRKNAWLAFKQLLMARRYSVQAMVVSLIDGGSRKLVLETAAENERRCWERDPRTKGQPPPGSHHRANSPEKQAARVLELLEAKGWVETTEDGRLYASKALKRWAETRYLPFELDLFNPAPKTVEEYEAMKAARFDGGLPPEAQDA